MRVKGHTIEEVLKKAKAFLPPAKFLIFEQIVREENAKKPRREFIEVEFKKDKITVA